MDSFVIEGGTPVQGEVAISGSKNAALPILCSSILADDTCTYQKIPDLRDIRTIIEVLSNLGMQVSGVDESCVLIEPTQITSQEAPYELVKSMRASILVLGPLLAKYGKAKVSLPGGCAIGVRPIDMHLKGLAKMGAEINLSHGYVVASAKQLKGARIVFDKPTVGGTENIMMAATLAKGTTVIEGAAKEPEVVDLADALTRMGAHISGAGSSTVSVEGVKSLTGLEYEVIPDRIETGTFIAAAAITHGQLMITGVRHDLIVSVVEKLRETGVIIKEIGQGKLFVDGRCEIRPIDVVTAPYPGFPTDMQAQIMALSCIGVGVSSITETIFENRFMHVPELMRMGANLEEKGTTVIVRGIKQFQGASVMATDLRASASMVLAALNAKGLTEIRRIYHLDRGYEELDMKLKSIGARVERIRGDL
ncbi:MAG: UDP-N-acetylglucosamine 1-carboxyvinyltransferase [Deltaproteobacteria bacterium]|nr:UDP-N-acetylglucosamine 1-carboxyvinyltransferase [Deltaproteobacteria bacterium]